MELLAMDIKLKSYLLSEYNLLFKSYSQINCPNGWFFILIWLCRYIQSIVNESELEQPTILMIYKAEGLLQIKFEDELNPVFLSVANYTNYISGFICEKTGNFKNVAFKPDTQETISMKNDDVSSDSIYIDNNKLRNIIYEVFK